MTVAAYVIRDGRLASIDPRGDLSQAVWIDLFKPGRADSERILELGIQIPRLEDMGQIEPSQRLTRRDEVDGITVMLTEPTGDGNDSFHPVTFLHTAERLVTVRFHGENLWNGFSLINRVTPGDVMVALLSLAVGHIADVLENCDRDLDRIAQQVFNEGASGQKVELREIIRGSGRMGEALSEIRLNLLILRRSVVHLEQLRAEGRCTYSRKQGLRTIDRDIDALTVHADFLSGRVGLAVDATMGLISLSQNDNSRYYSIVATIFLPATLIASIFGMNFDDIPLLHAVGGFEISLVLMGVASAGIFLYFLFRRWF